MAAGGDYGWVPRTVAILVPVPIRPVSNIPKSNAVFGASFQYLSRLKLKFTQSDDSSLAAANDSLSLMYLHLLKPVFSSIIKVWKFFTCGWHYRPDGQTQTCARTQVSRKKKWRGDKKKPFFFVLCFFFGSGTI